MRLEDFREPRRAAILLAKIARGAEAAHQAGIIHRDLEPGNKRFAAGVEPLVADFGLALLRDSEDDFHEQSLAIAREIGDRRGEGHARIRDGIQPRIAGVPIRPADGFAGGPVLMLRIRKSYAALPPAGQNPPTTAGPCRAVPRPGSAPAARPGAARRGR
jgi:serine/threonine protein kinase